MISQAFLSAEAALRRRNLSLSRLFEAADEVILFGSQAAGVSRVDSDVDLLCIGEFPNIHARDIDVTSISASTIQTPAWLTSELAHHVAVYGIWLKGSGEWRNRVCIGEVAITRKERMVRRYIDALEQRWTCLADRFRTSHLVSLRRDLRRLELMRAGEPVCPTALLNDTGLFDVAVGRRALDVARQKVAAE